MKVVTLFSAPENILIMQINIRMGEMLGGGGDIPACYRVVDEAVDLCSCVENKSITEGEGSSENCMSLHRRQRKSSSRSAIKLYRLLLK